MCSTFLPKPKWPFCIGSLRGHYQYNKEETTYSNKLKGYHFPHNKNPHNQVSFKKPLIQLIQLFLPHRQCDQIGRFIALWATFQSLWQQLFWPNCPRFCKGVKIFYFLVISFWAPFIDIWQLFAGHTVSIGYSLESSTLVSVESYNKQ